MPTFIACFKPIINPVYSAILLVTFLPTNAQSDQISIAFLYKTAKQLEKSFDSISFNHVYRKDNKRADSLSNDGLVKQEGTVG